MSNNIHVVYRQEGRHSTEYGQFSLAPELLERVIAERTAGTEDDLLEQIHQEDGLAQVICLGYTPLRVLSNAASGHLVTFEDEDEEYLFVFGPTECGAKICFVDKLLS